MFAALAAVWLTLDVLLDGPLRALDHTVYERAWATGVRIADPSRPLYLVKVAAYAATHFGDRVVMVLLAVGAAVVLALSRRTWRPVAQVAVLLVLLGGAVVGSKYAFGRAMPPVDGLHVGRDRSYPSGHSATAAVLWGLLARLAVEHRLRPVLAGPLRALRWAAPALTAAALMLLGYHWLTDVLAGLALGILLLRVAYELECRALRDLPGAPDRRAADPGPPPAPVDGPAPHLPAGRAGGPAT